MENVFKISLGPTFGSVRRARYHFYGRLPRPLGLTLEKWDTDRLFARLIRQASDTEERQSLETEHFFELQALEDARAAYVSRKVLAEADRLYLEKPPFHPDNEKTWERSNLTGQYRLTRRTVNELKDRIRQERKARRDPRLVFATAVSGWLGLMVKVIWG